jgi:Flp pilus assembly protein TadG
MAANFWRNRRGSITVLAATMLPALIGLAGLATEYGNALMQREKNQQIADIAAYSGALAYVGNGTTAAMNTAVSRIATLNGISANAVVASLVASPTGDGNQAVEATVTTDAPLALSRVLESATQLTVTATSYAELKSAGTACIIALNSSGTGVTLSGGTAITASSCAVASNATVTVPNGTSITAPVVEYMTTTTTVPCPTGTGTTCNLHAPSGGTLTVTHKSTTDTLNTNTTITGETSHLNSVALITSPSGPTPPTGTNLTLDWSTSSQTVGGCTEARSSGTWTVTCSGNGPFNFGNLILGGGITVNFNTRGSSSATYNFSGTINSTSSGTALSFGPGTFNIGGGIIVSGGMTMSFGAGTFNIGKLGSSCNSASNYSICNSGTSLTFAGPSTFTIAGGIYDAGGAITTLGTSTSGNTSPTTNSYNIGKASDGNSLYVGDIVTLADAMGTGDIFQMAGNINSSGGSCLVLGAAANHDINGYISVEGGTNFGRGTYSVSGYVAAGAGSGGDVSCTVNGTSSTIGIAGSSVTFGIAAASTPSGTANCGGAAFCISAGYAIDTLTAPTTGGLANLLVMGPTTSTNTAGASFAEGATSVSLSGVFYFPYGPVSLSGGSSVGNGTGQCLELIGSQVTLSGGTALATTCSGLGDGSTGTSIALVQ